MQSGQAELASNGGASNVQTPAASCHGLLRAIFALSLLLACCLPTPVLAVGLGQLEVRSTLAQPLDARIPVLGVPDAELDSLTAQLGSEALFRSSGIDRTAFLRTLRFAVVAADKQHPYIHITSPAPVKEPSLDFLVEVQTTSTSLVQHCVALFDPPQQQ